MDLIFTWWCFTSLSISFLSWLVVNLVCLPLWPFMSPCGHFVCLRLLCAAPLKINFLCDYFIILVFLSICSNFVLMFCVSSLYAPIGTLCSYFSSLCGCFMSLWCVTAVARSWSSGAEVPVVFLTVQVYFHLDSQQWLYELGVVVITELRDSLSFK